MQKATYKTSTLSFGSTDNADKSNSCRDFPRQLTAKAPFGRLLPKNEHSQNFGHCKFDSFPSKSALSVTAGKQRRNDAEIKVNVTHRLQSVRRFITIKAGRF